MTGILEDREKLLDAALPHVPFDGWSPKTFAAAAREAGYSPAEARALCPQGAVDLAVAYHRRGDRKMLERLAAADLAGMRFRDKVAHALWLRVEAMEDREAVRRAAGLFALPQNAAQSARLVWGTADRIWQALGDTSDDVNWYTKRATLSAVWTSVVLFWLGDDSPGAAETRAFIDRRIDDVMQIEKTKARMRDNPVGRAMLSLPDALLSRIRRGADRSGLPGRRRNATGREG